MQSTVEPNLDSIRIDESARLKESNERLRKLVGELLVKNEVLRLEVATLRQQSMNSKHPGEIQLD